MLGVVLCMKKLHLLEGTGVRKERNVACGFSPIKIHYSDNPKRINEVYVFSINYRYSNILMKRP